MNKTLRVWVCGGQCSGKSVLVKWIAAEYDLPVLDEVASIQIAKLGRTGFDKLRVDLDAVTAFQRGVFEMQLTMGRGMRRFVSDRAFDNLCYAAEHARPGTVADLWEDPRCRTYVRGIARAVERREGAVFFVRPGVDPDHNGTRSDKDLAPDAIHRLDGMTKLILELGRVRYVPINTTIFQERAAIVDATLRGLV